MLVVAAVRNTKHVCKSKERKRLEEKVDFFEQSTPPGL